MSPEDLRLLRLIERPELSASTVGLSTEHLGDSLIETARGAANSFSFVQLSDPHIGRCPKAAITFRRAIDSIEALRARPRFLIITGDLANRKPQHYRTFKAIVRRTRVPVYFVPGNHDVGNRISDRSIRRTEQYRRAVGADYYAFSVGSPENRTLFIALNSLYMRPWGTVIRRKRVRLQTHVDAQWDFLERELEHSVIPQSGVSGVFICLHHPLFTRRPEQRLASYLTVTMSAKRRMLALCERYRVQAVLSGHTHMHMDEDYCGTALITTPSVYWNAPQITETKPPLGYRIIHVADGHILHGYKTLDMTGLEDHRVGPAPLRQTWSNGRLLHSLAGGALNPRAAGAYRIAT